jgi:energy-coupling factor transporter ATP-binding protein EcfA2
MKYSELIQFDPIESVIQLTASNDALEAAGLVKSYVMSDNMATQIQSNMLIQLNLDDVVDNKGVLLVGNYGTGKSHLMSVISAIALDKSNLAYLRNQSFAAAAETIAGRFEVIRIEIGAVTTPLREIILSRVQQDFKTRGLTFDYPSADTATNNKGILADMMQLFGTKYPDKGYLIVVDEFLDFLGGKDDHAVRLDLGFMRELGEIVKESRLRVIFGVQEKLFDNPAFSFVSQTINRVRDRFEQVVIRKEDTAYVVSERILKKTDEQKAVIREHLQKFCSLYSNMSERIEEYVNLFPIHPSYIDVFNKIYIIENRHILANISKIISNILENEVDENSPGILSFDSYWLFIRDNFSYRTDANIKEVVEKSSQLEEIVNRSFPKKLYKPLALKIIHALSVHRLTTGDISLRAGLTSENLRDDMCLYLANLPDQSSDTLQSLVQTVLKDVMTTVSGQFIDHDTDNGQYYLDLKKDVDYDEKITQRAATIADESLNNYFYDIIYFCLDWDISEYVANFKIYEHTLNWHSHQIFRRGYLFLGTPESRPTAQPPEDYYIYFVPPYGTPGYTDEKKRDEVFFLFKQSDEFKNNLRLYAAACILKGLAEDKNKAAYQSKADVFKKKLTRFLSENKNTCFEIMYGGARKQPVEIMKGNYKVDNPFKETVDLVASLVFDGWFAEKYPEFPVFKTTVTIKNQAEAIRRAFDRFAGRKEALGNAMLDSFGLLNGENITIQNSKYAGYYAAMLDKLPPNAVLNFNDIYEERFATFVDRKFGVSYALLPIVLLGLVYTGRAVITLKNGAALSASTLENVPKISVMDIYEFKYLGRPKDLQLGELVRLFEIFELPVGMINDPNSREAGLVALLQKTQEAVSLAARAKAKLDGDFSLWGEPLIATHIVEQHKSATKRIIDMLGNFASRFNTVAKLNNFTYTMEEIEKLSADIAAAKAVMEYDAFKSNCADNVNYLTNIELLPIGDALKGSIEAAKQEFRKVRDSITADGIPGEVAALQVNEVLMAVKNAYVDVYYEQHKKHRLTAAESKRKAELINSGELGNLKRLAAIDEILPVSKLKAAETDLAALKTCYEVTSEILKVTHFCPKCGFTLGGNDPIVKGAVDRIEDRLDALLAEWTTTLLNTINDPLVLGQKQYLSAEQQKAVDEFVRKKALPEKVDQFFITAVKLLLNGFDAVSVDSGEFVSKLVSLGACDVDTFKREIDEIVAALSKGKDKSKLRIIIRG